MTRFKIFLPDPLPICSALIWTVNGRFSFQPLVTEILSLDLDFDPDQPKDWIQANESRSALLCMEKSFLYREL